jgi:SlyX protein
MNDRILKLEETVAHLTRVIDELSDVLARQEAEIERLKRRQEMLMRRDAERELAEGGTVPLTDQKPPHW